MQNDTEQWAREGALRLARGIEIERRRQEIDAVKTIQPFELLPPPTFVDPDSGRRELAPVRHSYTSVATFGEVALMPDSPRHSWPARQASRRAWSRGSNVLEPPGCRSTASSTCAWPWVDCFRSAFARTIITVAGSR